VTLGVLCVWCLVPAAVSVSHAKQTGIKVLQKSPKADSINPEGEDLFGLSMPELTKDGTVVTNPEPEFNQKVALSNGEKVKDNNIKISKTRDSDGGETTHISVKKSKGDKTSDKVSIIPEKHGKEKIVISQKKPGDDKSKAAVIKNKLKKKLGHSNAKKHHSESIPVFSRHSYGDSCTREFERQQCDGLTCSSAEGNKCAYCRTNSDCHTDNYKCSPSKHGSMFDLELSSCSPNQGANHGCLCFHKQLLPFAWSDAEAMLFTFLASIIAALAGIGGGGLLVPLYILIENFEADMASPLSSAAIMGGSMIGYSMYCRRWHERFPVIQQPLIDYETTALLLPALLMGTVFGTILDKLLPLWSIIVVMLILLFVTTARTALKAYSASVEEDEDEEPTAKPATLIAPRKPSESENSMLGDVSPVTSDEDDESRPGGDPFSFDLDAATLKKASQNSRERNPDNSAMVYDQPPSYEGPLLDQSTGDFRRLLSYAQQFDSAALKFPEHDADADSESEQQEQESEIEIEGSRFPVQLILFMTMVWTSVVLFAYFKGGTRVESPLPFVSCNNPGYWAVHGVGFLTLFIFFVLIRKDILSSASNLERDIMWDSCNTITVPMLALPAGAIAALCGIGGGMVIGPILLELGARPLSIPATSTFVVLVTASSSTFQFVLMGKLPFYYALVMFVIGAVGTFLGVSLQDFILSRTKKANLFIILVITMILLLSTILLTYSGIRNVIRMANEDGANFGLRNLCH